MTLLAFGVLLLIDFHFLVLPVINLSNLIYEEENTSSKIRYFSLLLSSVISAGTSFGKVLKWGYHPIITSFASFKFLKITIMLMLRMTIQAIVLAPMLRSLLYQYAVGGIFVGAVERELG